MKDETYTVELDNLTIILEVFNEQETRRYHANFLGRIAIYDLEKTKIDGMYLHRKDLVSKFVEAFKQSSSSTEEFLYSFLEINQFKGYTALCMAQEIVEKHPDSFTDTIKLAVNDFYQFLKGIFSSQTTMEPELENRLKDDDSATSEKYEQTETQREDVEETESAELLRAQALAHRIDNVHLTEEQHNQAERYSEQLLEAFAQSLRPRLG